MKHLSLSKFLVGLVFLLVLGIFYSSVSSAEQYCPGYKPPDSLAADRIAADRIRVLICFFGGGQASIIPPDPAHKKYYYTIEITRQPPGYTLNEKDLNSLIESITIDKPRLRKEALERGISLEERIKQYVEEILRASYPQFMAEVDRKAEEFRGELRQALDTILGKTREELSDDDKKKYDGIIEAYIEQIKDGFDPEDQIQLVNYMVGLKSAVADFIKTATGEDFDIFNSVHAGLLTYWAEWAFSLAFLGGLSADEAINYAISAIEDRKALVEDVNQYIFKGEGDVFSGEFSRVLSHFADMPYYRDGFSLEDAREEIKAFGERLEQDRQTLLSPLVQELVGGSIDTEEEQKILEKFTLILLAKLFEKFDKEAMDEFAKDRPSVEVNDVKYSRYETYRRENIKLTYVCPLGISDFFDGVKHQEVIGTIEQYIKDMLVINQAFQKRFGKSYDTTTLEGVEGLLGWALEVEAGMKQLMDHGYPAQQAHQEALKGVLDIIAKMEKFPGETGYLEGNGFAIDNKDIPTYGLVVPGSSLVVPGFSLFN